jgi:hypothetical protein
MFLRKFLEGKNILVICHHKNLLRAHPVSANLTASEAFLLQASAPVWVQAS